MEVVGSPIKFNYAATSLMYYVTSKRLFLLISYLVRRNECPCPIFVVKKSNSPMLQHATSLIIDELYQWKSEDYRFCL